MQIDGLFERAKLVAHATNVSTVIDEFDVRQMQLANAPQRRVLRQQMSVLYIVRYFHLLHRAQHAMQCNVSVSVSRGNSYHQTALDSHIFLLGTFQSGCIQSS